MAPRRQGPRPSPLERLREAYDRTQPRLWRALRAWSGSRDVADEATAEAFAQAARRIDALRDVDAWVWRAGFRIAAGELHRQRRQAFPAGDALDILDASGAPGIADADAGAGTGAGADTGLGAGRRGSARARAGGHHRHHHDDGDLPALAIDLVRALRQLTEQQRACVVLRDVAGLSAPEIAQILNTTAGTVRVQLFRSRRTLRHLLEADDD